ncbi:MAG: class I SAM-dependent methyltransferase [Clostridia bacterium]|nr:class I SAM-dependent methyltransferase [Clostridia bacterium]
MAELRNIFGSDTENYDRYRPRYTKELFEFVDRNTDGKKALEIGSGSGQATEWFLHNGYDVTCCEISGDFCDFLKEKYKNYPISVENKPFEDFEGENESYDLIFSATAFHWVDKDTGFAKLNALLKKGGTAALFWNVPYGAYDNEALYNEMQKAYNSDRKWENTYNKKYVFCKEYMEKYGFADVEVHTFQGARRLSADQYISLLETYSDHKAREEEAKQELYGKIASAINNHGGYINILDNIELYLARRK